MKKNLQFIKKNRTFANCMKRIIIVVILLTTCVSVTWASPSTAADSLARKRFAFSVEGSLAAGLNTFSPRGMQVSASAGLSFGQYVSVAAGLGVRHVYTLATVDRNIHGWGEPDQHTYGDRFLLPLFVRVKGVVPVGRFAWASTAFEPFARLDVGYAVDLQQSSRQRTAAGPFLLPAAGLDMRLQNGKSWTFALGVGLHAAQYLINDHAADATEYHTGNAVSLNFTLGHSF